MHTLEYDPDSPLNSLRVRSSPFQKSTSKPAMFSCSSKTKIDGRRELGHLGFAVPRSYLRR